MYCGICSPSIMPPNESIYYVRLCVCIYYINFLHLHSFDHEIWSLKRVAIGKKKALLTAAESCESTLHIGGCPAVTFDIALHARTSSWCFFLYIRCSGSASYTCSTRCDNMSKVIGVGISVYQLRSAVVEPILPLGGRAESARALG